MDVSFCMKGLEKWTNKFWAKDRLIMICNNGLIDLDGSMNAKLFDFAYGIILAERVVCESDCWINNPEQDHVMWLYFIWVFDKDHRDLVPSKMMNETKAREFL